MMNKPSRKAYVTNIAYKLGLNAERKEFLPTAWTIYENKMYEMEQICRIARIVGLDVHKHKGVWYENGKDLKTAVKAIAEKIKSNKHKKEKRNEQAKKEQD